MHIQQIITEANRMLLFVAGVIECKHDSIIQSLCATTSEILCTGIVSYLRKNIDALEAVQSRFTGLISGKGRLAYRLDGLFLYLLDFGRV